MPTHTLVVPDGASLAYHRFGAGPPQVVFVHGWMASSRVWDALRASLDGLSGLAVDLRGAGRSTAGRSAISLAQLAEDLLAVVDHAGLERFHLVGHSMGGQIVTSFAIAHAGRLRSLALLNPVPMSGLALPDEVARSFRAAGGSRAALEGILKAACRMLDDAARATLVDEALAIAPAVIAEGFDAWTRGADAAGPEPIDGVPTLVLGTDDPFLPPALLDAQVAARIRGAQLEHLPGPGHYPQVERPTETAARLRAFWERA